MAGEAEPGKAKAAGIVGILIGCIALINLICGFIYIGLVHGAVDGAGLYSGFGQLIIAILGVVTWLKLSKGAFVGYLVMCILWLIVTIVQVIIALIAWLIWWWFKTEAKKYCAQVGEKCICHGSKVLPTPVDDCDSIATIESVFIAMVIANVIGTILIFAGSIIGCMGTCCAKTNTTNVVVVTTTGMVMTTTTTNEAPPEYPATVKY
ncbi:hypothetical protein OS493_004422 [Desmophyllum pertusum]|uniref:Uncharacterized protein n=1 Tax=Desmophyllum pertusum TaxID=174260 RepID=A0A9W9ZTY0_9CNID|nr:hypothetical protein OS493_004422 [Desmophyllum pertusum]